MKQCILLLSFTLMTGPLYSQTIIKKVGQYVAFESDQPAGRQNDILTVQREIGNKRVNIGRIKLVKKVKSRYGAKIIEEYAPYLIQQGDIIFFNQRIQESKKNEDLDEPDSIADQILADEQKHATSAKSFQNIREFFPHSFRLSCEYGCARRLIQNPPDTPSHFYSYLEHLKYGYPINASISRKISRSTWFGIQCHIFNTSYTLENVYFPQSKSNSIAGFGVLKDEISVYYLGLHLMQLYPSSSYKIIGYWSFSGGGVYYKNNHQQITHLLVYEGFTWGTAIQLGLDCLFMEHIAFGISVSGFYSTLSSIDINGQNHDLLTNESLNRMDVSAGFKLYW